jgi:hypothetical protein
MLFSYDRRNIYDIYEHTPFILRGEKYESFLRYFVDKYAPDNGFTVANALEYLYNFGHKFAKDPVATTPSFYSRFKMNYSGLKIDNAVIEEIEQRVDNPDVALTAEYHTHRDKKNEWHTFTHFYRKNSVFPSILVVLYILGVFDGCQLNVDGLNYIYKGDRLLAIYYNVKMEFAPEYEFIKDHDYVFASDGHITVYAHDPGSLHVFHDNEKVQKYNMTKKHYMAEYVISAQSFGIQIDNNKLGAELSKNQKVQKVLGVPMAQLLDIYTYDPSNAPVPHEQSGGNVNMRMTYATNKNMYMYVNNMFK